MFYCKKNGFTLIELLSVIIILAIIALISSPIIVGLIDNARKESFKNTAYGIVDSGVKAYAKELLKAENSIELMTFTYTDGVESSNVPGKKLNYDGIKPKSGSVFINSEGQVAIAIHNGNYCTKKGYFDSEVILTDEAVENCNIPLYADASGASIPELTTGMIPVKWDGTEWVKAGVIDKWYDYNKQEWANAVTVTSTNRTTYLNAAVGTVIPMDDINTMWVWIPRFKYMIPAGSGAREIKVQFETKYTPKSIGDAINTYYTHPAFTFGETEISGIWVGKFETTGTIKAPTIKPGNQSIRGQTIKSMFDSIKIYMQGNSTFGFTNDNDIHMIKNTEWGAVAYLSGSKYGKYGNSLYTGINKEIYNNNSHFYAGRSMGAPGGKGIITTTTEWNPSGGYYTYDGKCASIHANLPAPCNSGDVGQIILDKSLAYGASTTGTIYGIYDMSGGSFEYTMSVYKPNPIPATGIIDYSGYSTALTDSQYDLLTIDNKYYNQYLTNSAATSAILGDATKETSSWYGDWSSFVNNTSTWFFRGGRMESGTGSGIFCFHANTGSSPGGINGAIGYRVVLSPNV